MHKRKGYGQFHCCIHKFVILRILFLIPVNLQIPSYIVTTPFTLTIAMTKSVRSIIPEVTFRCSLRVQPFIGSGVAVVSDWSKCFIRPIVSGFTDPVEH